MFLWGQSLKRIQNWREKSKNAHFTGDSPSKSWGQSLEKLWGQSLEELLEEFDEYNESDEYSDGDRRKAFRQKPDFLFIVSYLNAFKSRVG